MKFRKKSVVIEAMQFDGNDSFDDIYRWIGSDRVFQSRINETMSIDTLDGMMVAKKGDWIIKGIKGEFYPCKPDIFEESYDAVE